MTDLLPPRALRARFIDRATAKFAAQVPDYRRLRALVTDRGGRIEHDHGAIRSADPATTALFVRAARVLGLHRERDYRFPAKKLNSFDLQVPGDDPAAFKIFVSEVDLDSFPAEVAAAVRADCVAQAAAVDPAPLQALIARAESRGGLADADAKAFIALFVDRLMSRPGPPLARSTLVAVAAVSGEAASALALGPDFNHVTLDVRAAGFDGIEAMAAALRAAGFALLPAIQGAPGSPLRQTATMAATMATPVREADGRIGEAPTERQFVEIIERGQARAEDGSLLWADDGRPRIFRHFLAANAEQIFAAAATRGGAAAC